jgi:hypothetical protein
VRSVGSELAPRLLYKEASGEVEMSMLEKLIVGALMVVGAYLVIDSLEGSPKKTKNQVLSKGLETAEAEIPLPALPNENLPTPEEEMAQVVEDQLNESKEVTREPASISSNTSLHKLKVVGIIWDVQEPKAMIKDASNNLYIVKKQQVIGNTGLQIKDVREGAVIVASSQGQVFTVGFNH